MKQSRLELRENYEKACNAYLMAFCEKHGFDYADAAQSWVGEDVGGITLCADYYVGMPDIITDIDRDAPEEEYAKYYDYCLRVGSVANGELQTPNYESWLRGCPRLDEEQIARLEEFQSGIRNAEALMRMEIDRLNNLKQEWPCRRSTLTTATV